MSIRFVHCNQIWLECYDSRWWSGFYDQNKKSFIPKKIWSVPCTIDSSYFSQKMATWRPNFPHPRLWFKSLIDVSINVQLLWIPLERYILLRGVTGLSNLLTLVLFLFNILRDYWLFSHYPLEKKFFFIIKQNCSKIEYCIKISKFHSTNVF